MNKKDKETVVEAMYNVNIGNIDEANRIMSRLVGKSMSEGVRKRVKEYKDKVNEIIDKDNDSEYNPKMTPSFFFSR